MEEKQKTKTVRSRTDKGRWFSDIEPFTDSKRSMIADWYAYAMKYAETEIKRRENDTIKVPDSVIRDASSSALMYAVDRWKPDGGCSFKTFFHKSFYMRVTNACRRYIERQYETISENTPMRKSCKITSSSVLSGPTLIESYLFSIDSFEDSVLSDIYVDDIISRLSPLQRTAVTRCCINREKESDVARSLGTTKQNVNNALMAAYKTIRRIINGEIDMPRRGGNKRVEDVKNE